MLESLARNGFASLEAFEQDQLLGLKIAICLNSEYTEVVTSWAVHFWEGKLMANSVLEASVEQTLPAFNKVPALLALRFLDVSDEQIDLAVRDFAHALSQIQDVVIEQVPAYQLHQAMAALNPDWAQGSPTADHEAFIRLLCISLYLRFLAQTGHLSLSERQVLDQFNRYMPPRA